MERSVWDTPIRILRDGTTSVIPASELRRGDTVWRCDGVSGQVQELVKDEEEGMLYIGIDPVNVYPIQMFVREL